MGPIGYMGIGAGMSVLSDALGGALGGLFTNKKKLMKRAFKYQKSLNEQAAELNYQYGEKAAQNAYNRQLMMYDRSYKDQSYAAMRNQMENAGLSVGLMYGGTGNGGGAGSMTGAPQGETGGAVAGDAASILNLEIAARQLQLQESTTIAQNAKAYAEAEEIRSREKRNEAETDRTILATEQAREAFEWVLRGMKEDAKGKYLDNAIKQFMAEMDDFKGEKEINDKQFGKLRIKASAFFNTDAINRTIENAIKRDDVDGANLLRNAQKLLEDKKTYFYATEVLTSMIVANATAKNADTQRLEYGLHKIANEFKVKLDQAKIDEIANNVAMGWKELDATIKKIDAQITNETKETKFNTGGWAKFKILLQGLTAMAGAYAQIIGTNAKVLETVTP